MYKLKNHFGEWYQPHHSFVVRNPLFPVETFFNWKSEPGLPSTASEEILRKSLVDFYKQPISKEALYIGSPDLHEQLLLWLDNKIEKKDKKEKLELALVKYMARMCTRCTPYGLFASCTSGTVSDGNSITLSDRNSLQRFGRLDMDYICQAHSHLLNQKEICNQLCFYPNSSLYSLGNSFRYIEHRFTEPTGRSYHLVQVEQSIYLQKIITLSVKGATPLELAGTLTNNAISFDDALDFVYELILSQLLVSEIEPSVTGEEYFSLLLKKLKTLQHAECFTMQFEKVKDAFLQLQSSPQNDKHQLYLQIVEHLRQLEVPVHLKTLIQVDSYRPASASSISKKVMDEVLLGSSVLQLVTSHLSAPDSFSDFKTAFLKRYESQWVPLVEVLDTESGISYGKFATSGMEESPLIDKLPIINRQAASNRMQQAETENFKWQLYEESLAKEKTEVVITDDMLEKASKKGIMEEGLPHSICTLFKLHATSAKEVDDGNYTIALQPPFGPSGGRLLGRFCRLHPDIKSFTQTILQDEEKQQPDCIFAEIVHLPESRIGNILMRPVLRNYEIPYLCGSTLDDNHQIQITDLLVGVEDNKVVLRSKKLNKRIIPRLTSAHNFAMTSLPVYQFLCDLQYQQIRSIGWHWGVLDNRPFLPRVSYGKFILSKARWILTKDDVKDCSNKNEDDLLVTFSSITKKNKLSEYVLLSNGDNELMLHLQNIFCIKLLLAEVTKNGSVILTETLDTPGQCWIKDEEGSYAGEFMVAFNKNKIAENKLSKNDNDAERRFAVKRYFPLGSEWLYTKIYCGTKTGEKILCDVIKPLVEELQSQNCIDSFFFIRYYDEQGEHLRIRFHNGSNKDFWQHVLHRLRIVLQPYLNNHTVHNIQVETYQREIERYGFDTMELSETIFYHHSLATLNFISMLEGDEGEQYRWQVTLKAIDFILHDFHHDTHQKRDFLKMLHDSFSQEFGIGASEQKKISERFGNNKQLIQKIMNDELDTEEDLHKAINVFCIDSNGYQDAIHKILSASSVVNDGQQINKLLGSYLHMFINRMFVSNQRKIELVIYDYLLKYYESKIARDKKKNATPHLQQQTAGI